MSATITGNLKLLSDASGLPWTSHTRETGSRGHQGKRAKQEADARLSTALKALTKLQEDVKGIAAQNKDLMSFMSESKLHPPHTSE